MDQEAGGQARELVIQYEEDIAKRKRAWLNGFRLGFMAGGAFVVVIYVADRLLIG